MPMLPAAPVRFSMTTGWPQSCASLAPITRGRKSDGPPGLNGTMMRTGRTGKSCAIAHDAVSSNVASAIRKTLIGVGYQPDAPAYVSQTPPLEFDDARCPAVTVCDRL